MGVQFQLSNRSVICLQYEVSGFITVIFLLVFHRPCRSHYIYADGLVITAEDQTSLRWPYVTQRPSVIEAGTWHYVLRVKQVSIVRSSSPNKGPKVCQKRSAGFLGTLNGMEVKGPSLSS